jgi:hypothetical protein
MKTPRQPAVYKCYRIKISTLQDFMEESSRIANYFAVFFLRALGSVQLILLYKLNYLINSAQDKGARNLMITGKVHFAWRLVHLKHVLRFMLWKVKSAAACPYLDLGPCLFVKFVSVMPRALKTCTASVVRKVKTLTACPLRFGVDMLEDGVSRKWRCDQWRLLLSPSSYQTGSNIPRELNDTEGVSRKWRCDHWRPLLCNCSLVKTLFFVPLVIKRKFFFPGAERYKGVSRKWRCDHNDYCCCFFVNTYLYTTHARFSRCFLALIDLRVQAI